MRTDWEIKSLQSICSFSSGGTPSKKKKSYWEGDIPWVSGRDMKSTRISDTKLHISQAAVDESSTRMASPGDLLVLVRGMGLAHGAQVAEVMVPCAFNQDIRAIHPSKGLNSRFLLLALKTQINSSENVLSNAAHGTLKIDMNELRHVKIPVPSLAEQEYLVTLLDDIFTAITKAKQNTETCIENAQGLFDSHLNSAFLPRMSQRYGSEFWTRQTLGELSNIAYGYTAKAVHETVGPKFLRITDLTSTGVDWSNVPTCPISQEDLSKHQLESNDIVFARTGATTGKSHLIESPPVAVAASYLIRLRLNDTRAFAPFVHLYFQTREYWEEINRGMSGAAQGGFNATKLKALRIPLPPLAEQKKIKTELDKVLVETRKLLSIYSRRLAYLDELKNTLLVKAFAGQLSSNVAEKEVAKI